MGASLRELEDLLQSSGENFNEEYGKYKAAQEETAAAIRASDEMLYKYGLTDSAKEGAEKFEQAKQVIKEAQDKEKSAALLAKIALTQAQTVAAMVNMKKASLRKSRSADTTYVVCQARVECNFGMRESYLSLETTHGVMTKEIPQMTVKDAKLNTNIINFGGCRSMENPSVREAAEGAKRRSDRGIEKSKDARDAAVAVVKVARALNNPVRAIVEWFCKEDKKDDIESLMKECIGECAACFPANAAWEKGHIKVTINGKPVLLRRCTMRCNYGGRITILLSGQPE